MSKPAAGSAAILPIVALTFLAYLNVGLPLAVLPIFIHDRLGFAAVLAGLAVSIQYVATVISRAQVGRMTDRMGAKRTALRGFSFILVSGVLTVVGGLLSRWPAASFAVVVLGRLALGGGESMVGTGAVAWAIANGGSRRAVQAMSWNGIASYGAVALGAPVGVMLAALGGLPAIGVCTALVALGGLWLASVNVDAPSTHAAGAARPGTAQLLRAILPYGVSLGLASMGFGVLTAYVTLLYADRHWPGAAIAVTVFGAAFILARLALPGSIRRFGGLPVALFALAVECVGLLIIWRATRVEPVLIGAALTGMGFGPIFPALGTRVMAAAPPEAQGSAIGFYSVFLDVALGLSGPLAGVLIVRFGYESPFALGAAAVVCAFGLTLWAQLSGKAPARA